MWQHLLAPQIRLVDLCSADLTTGAALSQAKFEITNIISRISFLYIYKNLLKILVIIFTQNKQNGKFAVVYEAGIMAGLALITQAVRWQDFT